ncbi:MAG: glycerophosphodiester phosphodiesterase family protein [Steroidobacteraceae bacterium]
MTDPGPDDMMNAQGGLPPLIAHRGNALEFPENTLEALRSAVDLGLRYVEFDVQLTADHVAVVCHDADLQRMAGRPDCVHDLAWPELADIPAGEVARFGGKFPDVRIPSLARVAAALAAWPTVTAFVEIKRASLRRFGQDTVLERVVADVAAARDRCVFISFDLASVVRLRAMTGARIGWVIERFDADTEQLAREQAPDFLFGDVERIPAGTQHLWRGPWAWALYEVRDLDTARACAGLGADLVETMAVRGMAEGYARATSA